MKKIFFQKVKKANSGFTIVETMISVALFLIVVTISMGTLLNANAVHEKSRKMRSIMDSLSFAMEDISRNLRTGYNYHCLTGSDNLSAVSTPLSGQNCWGIAFESDTGTSNSNDQWVYIIDNTKKIFKSTNGGSSFIQLTPDEIVIDTGKSFFSVSGAEPPPGNTQQPFVTIKLVGTINYKGVVTPFSLQTSASQRLIDV